MHFLPYAVHSDNILAELGQAQILATFFIALVINSSLLVGIKWKYALDIILLTLNLSITALAVYFTFNSFDILKSIPSMGSIYIRSLLTHAKEDEEDNDDDNGLKFTPLEDVDDPELMNNFNDYDLSSQRRDIFDFELQDSPDPYIIVDGDDDGDNDNGGDDDDDDNDSSADGKDRDVHRKQTTQKDYLDSDYYSLSTRFNTPYN